MSPKITIITVVYNGIATLEKTISSVKNLDYPNIDFIIIDGGSKDGTIEIIKKHKNALKYWISEKDRGIYDAMNKGWIQADSDSYILYLGSGDEVLTLPDMFQAGVDDIYFGTVYFDHERRSSFKAVADFRLKMGNTLHHQALLIPKNAHPAPPFSIGYKVYGDFDFNQRLLRMGKKFVFRPEFTAYALPGGVSHKFNYRESLAIVRKNYGPFWVIMAVMYYVLLYLKWSVFKYDK